ncbi:hypothetical protein BC834DRAFT_850484 [Gloeopeniophorella convolvens]|nr:hypothetical protein BC834DRAFT_850484 [Gloeopeniophorella convolvens]
MGEEEVAAFYRIELERALSEQSFGVERSEIVYSNEHEAGASVTLLEGEIITAVLSSAGYKVSDAEHLARELAAQETYYETLDDLLSSKSPSYAAKRVNVLMAKLQGLAER